MEENKKHRITLTSGEINTLAHITRHFSDYLCGDDRPDHGMGILKGYREANLKSVHEGDFLGSWDRKPQYVQDVITTMGKFNRFHRKIR